MSFFSKYIAYIKNNPEGYWFKRKMYGWGWVPARWQGWAVIVAFAALLGLNVHILASVPVSDAAAEARFLLRTLVLLLMLLFVTYKTGEPPKWHWGIKDKK